MTGLIGIVVGAATLLLQFGLFRALALDETLSAEAVVRACVMSAAVSAWIGIDRADRAARRLSSRTLITVGVSALCVALIAAQAVPRIFSETSHPIVATGGVAAVVLGSAVGMLPVFGNRYAGPVMAVLLTVAGEQAVALLARGTPWVELPVGLIFVAAGVRLAAGRGLIPVALVIGAPVAVASLVGLVGFGVADPAEPPPYGLGWLVAGCLLGGLLGAFAWGRRIGIGPDGVPAPPLPADGQRPIGSRMGPEAHNGS